MIESLEGPAQIHAHPTDTEVEAKGRAENKIGHFRKIVLEYVQSRGEYGATGDEVYQHFQYDMFLRDRTESSVRTRLTELYRNFDLIFPSCLRRKNSRGNNEIVWLDKAFMSPDTIKASPDSQAKSEQATATAELERRNGTLLSVLRIIATTRCMCGHWEYCPRCLSLSVRRNEAAQ